MWLAWVLWLAHKVRGVKSAMFSFHPSPDTPGARMQNIYIFRMFSLTHNWSFLLLRVVQESLGLKESQIIGRTPQAIVTVIS